MYGCVTNMNSTEMKITRARTMDLTILRNAVRQRRRKFVDSYEQGLTPNPCIDCNRYLKFDRLLRRARELGCQWVVSGHYARIRKDPDSSFPRLWYPKDKKREPREIRGSLSFPGSCLHSRRKRSIMQKKRSVTV